MKEKKDISKPIEKAMDRGRWANNSVPEKYFTSGTKIVFKILNRYIFH